MEDTALIVRIPITAIDPTWTVEELQDNVVCYLQIVVGDAESKHAEDHPDDIPYKLDWRDMTVWTEQNFALDLADPTPDNGELNALRVDIATATGIAF